MTENQALLFPFLSPATFFDVFHFTLLFTSLGGFSCQVWELQAVMVPGLTYLASGSQELQFLWGPGTPTAGLPGWPSGVWDGTRDQSGDFLYAKQVLYHYTPGTSLLVLNRLIYYKSLLEVSNVPLSCVWNQETEQ